MDKITNKLKVPGWMWVPSLYFAEGLPYVIAMVVSVIMYKNFDISNVLIAFWTSLLYLPWVIKPIWSPFVELYFTKRTWIILMQIIIGLAFFLLAIFLQLPNWFPITLFSLWILAFSSATNDIASDGFYMIGLDNREQAFFVGIRSTFYRVAIITGQGLVVMLAGFIQNNTGLPPVSFKIQAIDEPVPDSLKEIETIGRSRKEGEPSIIMKANRNFIMISDSLVKRDTIDIEILLSEKPSDRKIVKFGFEEGSKDIYLVTQGVLKFDSTNWNKPQIVRITSDPGLKNNAVTTFIVSAGNVSFSWSVSFSVLGLLFILFALYHWIILPRPNDKRNVKVEESLKLYLNVFISFFRKKDLAVGVLFLLLYRFAESQLVKIAPPFLLDSIESGGLGLSTSQVGFIYGTVGVIALMVGGIIGGIASSVYGLRKLIWWMAVAINLPDFVYIYLSHFQPEGIIIIGICIVIEQLGYGFGFTGYMLYMIYLADGEYKTAHYAIATGFMALGMMIPGMISGKIQDLIGYHNFFIYISISTIVSFIAVGLIRIPPGFGKRRT